MQAAVRVAVRAEALVSERVPVQAEARAEARVAERVPVQAAVRVEARVAERVPVQAEVRAEALASERVPVQAEVRAEALASERVPVQAEVRAEALASERVPVQAAVRVEALASERVPVLAEVPAPVAVSARIRDLPPERFPSLLSSFRSAYGGRWRETVPDIWPRESVRIRLFFYPCSWYRSVISNGQGNIPCFMQTRQTVTTHNAEHLMSVVPDGTWGMTPDPLPAMNCRAVVRRP